MSLCNMAPAPSAVKDRIYELMKLPEFIINSKTLFRETLLAKVIEMMGEEFPSIEWQTFCTISADNRYTTVSFAWVENGRVHLIGWDCMVEEWYAVTQGLTSILDLAREGVE